MMNFIFELISSILLHSSHFFTGLNTKKIDSHINELRQYAWFNELFENEKFRRLFFGNVHVRKYLKSNFRIRRLIKSQFSQARFKLFLEKQLQRQRTN